VGRLLKHSRKLIPALLVIFLGFLAQPQIATLHHTHAGDDRPHVHADLLLLPASFHTHEHPHLHHHIHEHDHPHQHPHLPYPQNIHTPITSHTPFPLLASHSSSRGHWHTASTFHLPGSIVTTPALPRLATHFLLIATRSLFLPAQETIPRSRAPPSPL